MRILLIAWMVFSVMLVLAVAGVTAAYFSVAWARQGAATLLVGWATAACVLAALAVFWRMNCGARVPVAVHGRGRARRHHRR